MKKNIMPIILLFLISFAVMSLECAEMRNLALMMDVSASSTLSNKKFDFNPKNVLDDNPETAWQPSGSGVGEWIEFYPVRVKSEGIGAYSITSIKILNGYQYNDSKHGDLYYKNNRIAQMTIIWNYSEGKSGRKAVTLKDVKGWQTIPVNIPGGARIRLQVDSIYKGSKWNDMAVSDVKILGRLR